MNRVKIFLKALFFVTAFAVTLFLLTFRFLAFFMASKSPIQSVSKIYVSETPFSYFAYNEKTHVYSGIIEYDEKEQEFFFLDDGNYIACWKLQHLSHINDCREYSASLCENELLFIGYRYASDNDNDMLIKITLDNIGLFNENNERLRFVSYDKDEYIQEYAPLKLVE